MEKLRIKDNVTFADIILLEKRTENHREEGRQARMKKGRREKGRKGNWWAQLP